MAATAEDAVEVIGIDPQGDVVFICTEGKDADSEKTVRIRNSSTLLMAMSPVFKSMLGPRFREGRQLGQDLTVEIELPDDEPRALTIMLNVLHLRNDFVPNALESRQLVDVVTLADKYLCVDRLQLAARLWLKAFEHTTDAQTLCRVLTACFRMGMDEMFDQFARQIVMSSRGFAHFNTDDSKYGVDKEDTFIYTFSLLNKYLNKRFSDISFFIKTTTDTFVRARDIYIDTACGPSCHVAEVATYELLTMLRSKCLDDEVRSCHALDKVLEELRSMPNFPFSDRYEACSDRCVFHELAKMQRGKFDEIADEHTPPARLLCSKGRRQYGHWKCFTGYKSCAHCGEEDCSSAI